MGENSDDNDPFEEDIVFDQSGLLSNSRSSSYSRHQVTTGVIPTFMLFIRTVFLWVAFIGLGLCASISSGPVIHLEVAVGVPTQNAFHSFTAHSIGMLIGGLLGSILFEIYNRQFLIFVSLIWMSVSVSVLPFTIPVSYWWTLVNLAALGAGLSFLFTGSNVLCLDLWGKQGGASLQALHFSFAVGAFIAPILIHPFISDAYSQSQKDKNFSPLPPLPSMSQKLEKVKRNANYSLLEDIPNFEDAKFQNLSISSTSLENLTFPGEDFQENITESVHVVNGVPLMPANFSSIQHLNHSKLNESQVSKVPKPKPSFTNANLIPEHSKWKRPPKKDSVKQQEQSVEKSGTNHAESVNNSTQTPQNKVSSTTTVPELRPEILKNDADKTDITPSGDGTNATLNDTLPLREGSVDNEVTTSLPSVYSEVSVLDVNKLSNSANQSDASFTSHTDAVTVTTTADTTSTANGSAFNYSLNSDQFSLRNVSSFHEGLNTSINNSLLNQIPENETIQRNDSLDDEKYVIDFSSSYSDWGDETRTEPLYPDDEFMGEDFTDYNIAMGKGSSKQKPSLTEPELLDLKELPPGDNEASTISVTASFSGEVDNQERHQAKPGTYSNSSDTNIRFFESLVERFKNYGVTSIHFVYICVGIFLLLNAFISVIIMCHNPREPRSKQEDLTGMALNKLFFFVFSIYMFASEAVEGAIRHLLASSQTENGLPVSRGMDGAALFWGLVCVMRFICILISGCLKVKPGKILVASTFLTVVGTIFLCVGTFDKRDFLWGGLVVVALGLAPVLPTSFLWMAERMRVSHRLCATMIVISSFGNSLTHTTLTHVLANSHLYAYIMIGISSSAMVFLSISFCLLYRAQNSKTLVVPIGYQLASQEEEETLELTRPTPKNFDNINRRLSEMGEAGQALLID